jgi:eukaryotic-like serine/threonine-protein kinase
MERNPPTIAADQLVGRYRVMRPIGTGAMGEVFLAIDDSLNRRAAIKLLGLKHLGDETVRERFLREARALARLNHPNLITVYESGFLGPEQRPYFAMELLEGGDTEKLMMEQGPLPSGVVALIGAQAAAGLGEAARAKIIHRDVKPANLGISAHGVLKVTDFSLAKSHAIERHLTARGFVVGTADYIAPEQARGEPLDERADVYALGCTLHHLLTGRPPYRSSGRTEVKQYVEIMQAHISAPIPDPRDLVPTVDEELALVIRAAMDKDRERRATFEELAPQLLRIHKRLGGQLPRLTRPLFTLPAPTAPMATVSDDAKIESDDLISVPHRRSPLVIAAIIASLAAAGVIYALMSQ